MDRSIGIGATTSSDLNTGAARRMLMASAGYRCPVIMMWLRAVPGLRQHWDRMSFDDAVAEAGFGDRMSIESAPTETAVLGGEHDTVRVNHVIHRFTPEQSRTILANVRAAAGSGATLLMLGFFLDDDQRQRLIDALHVGEYLVIDGTVIYTGSEVRQWLTGSGWRPREIPTFPGSSRVLVAEAI